MLAVVTAALAAAVPSYATPETAMTAAVRDAAAQARIAKLSVACRGGLWEVGERGTCEGGFVLRGGARRAFYRLTWRSRTLRTSTTTITAKLDATRRGGRGFPERLAGSATRAGPEPPAERTDHADLVLQRGDEQTLSRKTWVAFPRPYWWGQAYGEGPVTMVGGSDYLYDLPPAGMCAVTLLIGATVAADGPTERDGRVYDGPDDIDGRPIVRRTDDGAGTTTWLLEDQAGLVKGIRSGPAPRGVGPPELDTLVVRGDFWSELERFGEPGRDGYPLLPTSRTQEARCSALTARNAAALIPRALAEARPAQRRRPPRPDPDDEAQLPLDPRY